MQKHRKYGIMPRHACPAGIAIIACIALALTAGCTSGNPPAVTPLPTTPPIPAPSPVITETATIPITLPPVSLTGTLQPGPTGCTSDAECVPAQCCHPDSCINAAAKHVCILMCTNVCQGPIDCGAGHCGCVNRQCAVVQGPPP